VAKPALIENNLYVKQRRENLESKHIKRNMDDYIIKLFVTRRMEKPITVNKRRRITLSFAPTNGDTARDFI
jgi:hypothetical protein